MGLGIVRITRKHGMRSVAYQYQTLTMPDWEWGPVEQFPEFDVCSFSACLLGIVVEIRDGVFDCVLHSGDQVWVEGLELVEEIRRVCAYVPVWWIYC